MRTKGRFRLTPGISGDRLHNADDSGAVARVRGMPLVGDFGRIQRPPSDSFVDPLPYDLPRLDTFR